MKRFVLLASLLYAAGCGTPAPAGSEIPAGLEVWQVTIAGNNNLFTLGVENGQVKMLGEANGIRTLPQPAAFDTSKSPLQVGFRVDADLFGQGAAETTEILIVAQRQSDGSFAGIVQIRAVNRDNAQYSQTCTVTRTS